MNKHDAFRRMCQAREALIAQLECALAVGEITPELREAAEQHMRERRQFEELAR